MSWPLAPVNFFFPIYPLALILIRCSRQDTAGAKLSLSNNILTLDKIDKIWDMTTFVNNSNKPSPYLPNWNDIQGFKFLNQDLSFGLDVGFGLELVN